MKKVFSFIIYLLFSFSFFAKAQQYDDPLKIPILLSGGFGELRNNHFHSGIDLKTQGVVRKTVHSIEDGYVSRISISPTGYGKALYITHPSTGHVSVYGHLDGYIPKLEKYIKEQQYEQESFKVDLRPEKDMFPVKRGEIVAYSGNSGSSGGPHVHFEIREAESDRVLDPLKYYEDRIKDEVEPEVRGVAVYPLDGEGVVNNSSRPLRFNLQRSKKGNPLSPDKPIVAWGKIGLAIKAYDKMSGTTNIYGVKEIRMYVESELVFKSRIESYGFDQTRMLNTFVDFADWRNNKSFFMKSFIDPGNTLDFYDRSLGDGYFTINKEGYYHIRYELEDIYGNIQHYTFNIEGKKQEIPVAKEGSLYMVWDEDNRYISESFSLIVPRGNLYNNFMFTLGKRQSAKYFSDILRVNDEPVPFHNQGEMKIKLTKDTLVNKQQYGIVILNGTKERWVGGVYSDGVVVASVREIGAEYTVSSDNVAPVITAVQPQQWEKQSKISIKLSDDKSGIKSYRGTIDGEFVLFEHDMKSPVYIYKFDSSRLKKSQKHKLIFTATDACGNTSEYTSEFYY